MTLPTRGVVLARNELPRSVRTLIEHHIHSAADVGTLLLLCRTDQPWTATAVARQLRIDETQAGGILARLRRQGLLRKVGEAYRFHPRDPAAADAVAHLSELYPAYQLAILELIYARATGPIRDFSDAFRLRRDGSD